MIDVKDASSTLLYVPEGLLVGRLLSCGKSIKNKEATLNYCLLLHLQFPDMHSLYFMLSNGSYCHILADKIIFTDHKTIEQVPEMNHRNNNLLNAFFFIALLTILAVFSFLYLKQNAPVEFIIVLFPLCIFGLVYLILNRDLSTTQCIDRKFIKKVSIKIREMGYTTVSFVFETNTGETLRKHIRVYDTPDQEQKALTILKEEGLI